MDEQLIGSYTNTSPNNALNWQAISFSFQGNGQARKLRIQLEGGSDTRSAKAAMLDALQLVETLPNSASVVYGFENSPIALAKIGVHPAEGDSGTLKTELLGLPKGATLSDGSRTFKATRSNASLDLAGWNLEQLSLTPPRGFEGAIGLQPRTTTLALEPGGTRQIKLRTANGGAQAIDVAHPIGTRYVSSDERIATVDE